MPLENVVGMRPGTESGSIVIVAPRDALGAPATASASGTAMLMELARDLEGETLHRSVVLASTSGTQGTAGAIRLAATLAGPVDAVLVLGDVASTQIKQPIILPWSTRQDVAPTGLRNTVASALAAQSSLSNCVHRPRRAVRAPGLPVHAGPAGTLRGPGHSGGGAVALGRAGARRRTPRPWMPTS